MAVSGLRPGEVSALRWCDFFAEFSGFVVFRAVESGTGQIKGLKTAHSGRTFKPAILDAVTVEQLLELRRRRHALDEELIFTVPQTGSLVKIATVEKIFKGAKKRAGVGGNATPYTLRHTFQTRMLGKLSQGAVADLMGHVKYRPDYDHRSGGDLLQQHSHVKNLIGF